MNDITPLRGTNVTPYNGLDRTSATPQALPTRLRRNDQAEISVVGRMLSLLSDLPVRQDMVDRVRQEIASGTYDTPDKLQAALDTVLDDLA
jgi:negative regulator of flagellin synthesis FlgM